MSVSVLWPRFGPSGEQGSPDSAAIAEALDAVGLGSCSIAGGIVHKKRASTCFDFSSVAKGYGVKAIADMLARNGCTDFMVEVGVATAGVSRWMPPWVAIPIKGIRYLRSGRKGQLWLPQETTAM